MSNIPMDIPHVMVSIYPNPTKYGSFVVELRNDDTNEFFEGKAFTYDGLQPKIGGSGHTYHKRISRKN